MKNKIYVMYNTLSKRYGEVFAAASDDMAEKNKRKQMERFEEDMSDYELVKIGVIEIETGIITPCDPIRIAWREKPVELPVRNTAE